MQIDCNNEEIELRITEIEAILDNELYEDEDEKRCLELELQDLIYYIYKMIDSKLIRLRRKKENYCEKNE